MDEAFYKIGASVALEDFTKEALPLWAYPLAAGIGALGGAAIGETPGIGALQGAVLAPAALLGGHAAWRHAVKSAPSMKSWVAAQRLRQAEPGMKAMRQARKVPAAGTRGYARPGVRSSKMKEKALRATAAEREAFKQEQLLRRIGYAGAGGLAAGAGTYGLGRLGFGGFSDIIRAPGRAEKTREQQLMELAQMQQAQQYPYPYY